MQFRIFAAFLIFIGSYLPLAIILAVQDIPSSWWAQPVCGMEELVSGNCSFLPFRNPVLSMCILLATIASICLFGFVLRKIDFPHSVTVKESKAIPNEVINYTFPYVVSFMGISYSEPEKLLGFLVFLLWMFAITYKSGQIVMNPLLLMFGWRLYEAKISINGQELNVRLLNKGDLEPVTYSGQKIQDFFILEKRNAG